MTTKEKEREEYERYEAEMDRTIFCPQFIPGTLWKTEINLSADPVNDVHYSGRKRHIIQKQSIFMIAKQSPGVFTCHILYNEICLTINSAILMAEEQDGNLKRVL
jgi:hypothetical protein